MGFSRVFVLLSITLCLVACLCAHAAVSRAEAQKAVTDLKTRTAQTLKKAQDKYTDAKRVEKNVEARKQKAENAATEAEAKANGNEEAKPFAETAKSEMQQCLQLHPDAKERADKAVPVMENLMNKARALDKEAEINVAPKEGSGDDYAHVIQSVDAVEAKRNGLEGEIEAAKPQLEAAEVAFDKLSNHADKAEMAKDKVKAVVAVAQMNTLLSQADTDIASIQEKKQEVDGTVKEIGEMFEKAPQDLIPQLFGINNNAGGDVREITRIVKQVQEEKNAMLEHKKTADGFLAQIKTETDESQVRQYLRGITDSAGKAEESLKKINQAVKSADIHVKSANNRKQEMENLISPKSSKPTDTDTAATKHKKPEETEKGRETKPTDTDTAATKHKKPDQPAKDGKKKPADKDGVPALGGNSDSAITVSFSLLLALIACAALH